MTRVKVPTLTGKRVRLEPLFQSHFSGLETVAFDPAIWRYMLVRIADREELQTWIDSALATPSEKQITWVTFATRGAENRLVGSTRLIDIDMRHRTAEIGHTWIAPALHGTGINAEAKLLQLTYAFEDLEMNRIAFKTHHENLQSQAAIRKLGAGYEGTFRNHYVMPDGSLRHSVWFSITREEWPQVRSRLMARLREDQPFA
ncbi:GNAT family N-acetyltransferase [Edaphobacter sp. HDX4]